jgi:hypothetical protein
MKSHYRTPFTYFDLIETFPKPGCALCNLLQRDVQQYIDNMLFEYANDPGLRAHFSAGRGMCYEHGQMMRYNRIGNVIGIARLYRDTLDELLRILDETPVSAADQPRLQRLLGAPPRADSSPLADALEPAADCAACERMIEFEKSYLDTFSKYLTDERFAAAYRESQGVCLPHFRLMLRHMDNPDSLQAAIHIQRDIWRSLHDEVALFMDKQNYEHIGDPVGSEGDSWVRAILRMAGERGIFGTRRGG